MIYVGTSGYNYPEWKGSFYPDRFPAARMLGYYAERFRTVEINYTFYRMPTERVISGWLSATPESFLFSLKAPRRITHDRRLKGCGPLVRDFSRVASGLGTRLGVLLFQLAPTFRCDVEALDELLGELPARARAAFEFRHPSWHDEVVFSRLRDRNLALCVADGERVSTPVVATADYGYLRLRDLGYADDDLARWAAVVDGHRDRWREAFVYFKHEEEGKGPAFAASFIQKIGGTAS